MDIKLKNGLIHALTYLIATSGTVVILIFQYFPKSNPMPTWAKITVPCLLALLIFFLVYFKSLKERINRKLIAIETAKELGKAAKTNSIVANLLETMGIVVPLLLIGLIFIIGGEYLAKTGLVLLEILAMYTVVIIGNIICDSNTKQELAKEELARADALAGKIASKIENLPKKYE